MTPIFFLLVKIDLFWKADGGASDVSVQSCAGAAEKAFCFVTDPGVAPLQTAHVSLTRACC